MKLAFAATGHAGASFASSQTQIDDSPKGSKGGFMSMRTTNHNVTGDVLLAENEVDHLEPLATVPFPSKPGKGTQAAERKKRRMQFDRQHGYEDGQKWAEGLHPSEIRAFIKRVGECPSQRRRPWVDLDESFLALREQLESWGNDYALAFIARVRSHWHLIKMPWHNVLYSEGITDGQTWAEDPRHQEQLERIECEFREHCVETAGLALSFWEQLEFGTPAHVVVVWAMGDAYPRLPPVDEDEIGDIVFDCDEFKQFWQPFVAEPMDEVVQHLKRIRGPFSKLISETYIGGFIDGALGISQELMAKHQPGRT